MKEKIVLALMLIFALSLSAQNEVLRKKHFNLTKGVAISGYDPVAYFTQNKAIEGSSKITYTYDGVVYHFCSDANLELFKKTPAMYEPQYGGWCAYAMGNTGEKVEVDPNTFKIINGKLYLFYNKFFNNTLKTWNKDEATLKTKADKNWATIYK